MSTLPSPEPEPNGGQPSFNQTAVPAWPSYLAGKIVTISSTSIDAVTDDYRKEQIDFLNTNGEIISGF